MKTQLAFDFLPESVFSTASYLFRLCPAYIYAITFANNNLIVYTYPAYISRLALIAKRHLNVQMPFDFTAADYPQRPFRFSLLALLRLYFTNVPQSTFSFNRRFNLVISTLASDFTAVPSMSHIFPSMLWPERELWDLFGIFFKNHGDLRRLLSDYGFQGHVLRKDFPLSGFLEVRYDDGLQRIVCEPLELTQEYRHFDFLSPWVSTV